MFIVSLSVGSLGMVEGSTVRLDLPRMSVATVTLRS